MVFLSQAAEEPSESFVVCLLQPLTELMVGGTEKLFLCKLLLLLHDLLEVSNWHVAAKDPFQELLFEAGLIKLFGGVLRDPRCHIFEVLKEPWISAKVG